MWPEDLFDRIKYKIWHPIKWAWQRLYRGWDDRVIWGIDIYLAKMIPIWLHRLKEIQHGYPAQFEGPEEWDEVLAIIIDGFEAARQIQDRDFPAWDWLVRKEKKRYGRRLNILKPEDLARLNVLKEETNFWKILKAQEAATMIKFQAGMDLFKEHFFDLWD